MKAWFCMKDRNTLKNKSAAPLLLTEAVVNYEASIALENPDAEPIAELPMHDEQHVALENPVEEAIEVAHEVEDAVEAEVEDMESAGSIVATDTQH
eukprot:8102534-Lingulodinium_polyedra.AAC.1